MTLRLFLLLALGLTPALAQSPAPAPVPAPAPPQTYALLVGGLTGPEAYGKWYPDWLHRFQVYLTDTVHVPGDHVTVLSGPAATSDAITTALGKIAKETQPQDQVILFIVGHGEIRGDVPTLTLPGPDLTAPQLAALLKAIPAKSQVVLNFSASSGDFLKLLSAPGRINLTAVSPTENQEPVFAEFFLRGLESKRADQDKNGTITLLEAYNWAAQQTAWWIARWTQSDAGDKSDPTSPTTWKASGKETVEIFQKLYADLPMRKLDPTSDAKADDAPVALQPPDGQVTGDWANRRVVDEHALLEDSGEGIGVSVITDKGIIQPILGQKPGDPGYVAAHTSLGQPAPATP